MYLEVVAWITGIISYIILGLVMFGLGVAKWRAYIKWYRDHHTEDFSPYLALAFIAGVFWPVSLILVGLYAIFFLPLKALHWMLMLSYNTGMGRSNIHLGRRMRGLFWHTTAKIVNEH
jgi:hypothetical protein